LVGALAGFSLVRSSDFVASGVPEGAPVGVAAG
jgi:hypothetical protein